MNYIVGVNEFWFYIVLSALAGILVTWFYYKARIEAEVNTNERQLREGHKKQLFELQAELQLSNEQVATLTSENQNLLGKVNSLAAKCDALVSEVEQYELRHKQIEFEVATVQKYYKDARIDTTITI
ncbi:MULTISPECIES: hypothetical protein [Vibrio]|uniref:hypothetical protein n=1 Tax=Vibrio TaxID=662 RepID=UPI0004700ECF|nr:hypothetical protein [Vibrio parahaemolyticus]MDF5406023.1 hypothetical protein [Vibrio parahaemolyticus]MDG2821520.1 hypothetical protein [Vibrio parahaemolyticus]MDG2844664.1 hypothetical protein [Vibrio parahaemolyticus]MDG2856812.1 hypothetical protein [Vibrio parahaemolyticus]MDG2865569.1 hypothetical protein [Vibrio parahaemolyticus]